MVRFRLLLPPVLLLLLVGCSSAAFKAEADAEVYEIIRNKQMVAIGEERPFSIESEERDPLMGLVPRMVEHPGDMPPSDGFVIGLHQALEMAAEHNREHQARKEDLYRSALDLTAERYRWGPILGGRISTRYTNSSNDETIGADGSFTFSQAFSDGSDLDIRISTSALLHLVSNPREAAASLITATLTKPLWRGATQRVAQENLLQAERDVVYSVRSFSRYRKTFVVSVASAYYRVLQQRDGVSNAWNNYQNLIVARERTEMMAEAGRLPEFQVDQAKQNELRAKDRYVRALQSYEQSLDQFKIRLGLPTDASISLDPAEFDLLRETGIFHPELSAEDAMDIALAARLDLATAYDQVDDAGRKVVVTENGLAPDINLVLTSRVFSAPTQPTLYKDQGTHGAGIDIELPLNRRNQRNAHRRSLINLERSKRDASLAADNVKLEVRAAWRRLQEAMASYEIQTMSLELAERRVESTTLLLQAGRANTRDLLDAQDSLLEAQNAVTRALIDHTIARLEFWRDLETLEVTDAGLWQEEIDGVSPAANGEQPEGDEQ